jgi:hypothetical protein
MLPAINSFVIGINDERKFEKFVTLIGYFKCFTTHATFNVNGNYLYIQIMNPDRSILFELSIPTYWFDYFHFRNEDNLQITVEMNTLYNVLNDRCPGFIWISYDIGNPTYIIINSEDTYYENPFNVDLSPEQCYWEMRCGTSQIEPLLDVISNDKYQYHLVIEQHKLQSIITEASNVGCKLLSFHCSNQLDEVIVLCGNNPAVILSNHNSESECENFISMFSVILLSQLPFSAIECVVIHLFLSPNMPIKVVFPLDENDDLLDLNINIVPTEVHNVNSDENDFLNMCLAMSRTNI